MLTRRYDLPFKLWSPPFPIPYRGMPCGSCVCLTALRPRAWYPPCGRIVARVLSPISPAVLAADGCARSGGPIGATPATGRRAVLSPVALAQRADQQVARRLRLTSTVSCNSHRRLCRGAVWSDAQRRVGLTGGARFSSTLAAATLIATAYHRRDMSAKPVSTHAVRVQLGPPRY